MPKVTSAAQLDELINMGAFAVDTGVLSPEMRSLLDLYTAGTQSMQQGSLETAIYIYRDILSTWPEFVAARVNLANCLVLSGKPREALQQLERAHHFASRDPDIHIAAGSAYDSMGDKEQEIRQYQEALEDAPCHVQAMNNLGAAYREIGQLRMSEEWLRRALEEAKSQDSMLALTGWQHAGKLQILYNLALTCQDGGDWTSAVKYWRECVALSPSNPELRQSLQQAEIHAQQETSKSRLTDQGRCPEGRTFTLRPATAEGRHGDLRISRHEEPRSQPEALSPRMPSRQGARSTQRRVASKRLWVLIGVMVMVLVFGVALPLTGVVDGAHGTNSASIPTDNPAVVTYSIPIAEPDSSFLPTPAASPSPLPSSTQTATPAAVSLLVQTTITSNLRAGPATTFDVVGVLNLGTSVTPIESTSDGTWWHVRVTQQDLEGWIHSSLLSNTDELMPIPTAISIPSPPTLEPTSASESASASKSEPTAISPPAVAESTVATESQAPVTSDGWRFSYNGPISTLEYVADSVLPKYPSNGLFVTVPIQIDYIGQGPRVLSLEPFLGPAHTAVELRLVDDNGDEYLPEFFANHLIDSRQAKTYTITCVFDVPDGVTFERINIYEAETYNKPEKLVGAISLP